MSGFVTLNRNKDFIRAYSKGKSFVSPVLVIYVIKNRKKVARIGITASKKIGNAVQRNRARRLIRESVRKIYPNLSTDFDFVFVARKKTFFEKSPKILKATEKILKKEGYLK